MTSRREHDAAVAELEQLLDTRPAEGDVLARRAWDRLHLLRVQALELLLSGPVPEPEPEPEPLPEVVLPPEPEPIPIPDAPAKPEEATMPTTKTPEEKLETMTARLERYEAEGLRRHAAQVCSLIRSHCAQHGLPVPDSAALQTCPAPEKRRLKKAVAGVAETLGVSAEAVAEAAEASVASRPEPAPLAPPAPLPDRIAQGMVVDARALLWRCMAHLEVMPPAARRAMVGDLTLLRSASETALLVAHGRVAEVGA